MRLLRSPPPPNRSSLVGVPANNRPEHGGPNRSCFLTYGRGTRVMRDDGFHDPSVQKWTDDHNSPDQTNGLC
jgi:hypothetical protein